MNAMSPDHYSAAAGTWAGKCEACGAEYFYLPASDEGVCAKCGCHSVFQRREPPFREPDKLASPVVW